MPIMRRAVVAAGLLFAAALPGLADEAFDTCMSGGGSEKQCGEQWIAREQARVDATWRELIGQTEGNVSAKLAAEQHAWEAFRDAACTFKLDDGFGEAGGFYTCRAELISARGAALDAYLKYIDN
jgi:uncharacterized protein YecT (DUF1311 family)